MSEEMETFSFTLRLHTTSPDTADRIFEAGIDDALLVETGGRTFLDFDRQARTRGEAIASAMAAVLGAGISVSIHNDGSEP